MTAISDALWKMREKEECILQSCRNCGKVKFDGKWGFLLDVVFKAVAENRHFTFSDNTVICPTCKAKIPRLIL